jgi:hypothetical protein
MGEHAANLIVQCACGEASQRPVRTSIMILGVKQHLLSILIK